MGSAGSSRKAKGPTVAAKSPVTPKAAAGKARAEEPVKEHDHPPARAKVAAKPPAPAPKVPVRAMGGAVKGHAGEAPTAADRGAPPALPIPIASFTF
jgi:hypothetical protein